MPPSESPWRKTSNWIPAVLALWICSRIRAQNNINIEINNRVSVALNGEDVHFTFTLTVPVNQSGRLDCFNPQRQTLPISEPFLSINSLTDTKRTRTLAIMNTSQAHSGEYQCKFKEADVSWSLLVRERGFEEWFPLSIYTGPLVAGILSVGLCLFSVGGSVYVFTGYWNAPKDAKCNARRQQREGEKDKEGDGDRSHEEAASDSVYQSLESRPKSIYDVLDHSVSAVPPQPNQKKAKQKPVEAKKTIGPATEVQESVECVYENF